jgi:hypothetical protein
MLTEALLWRHSNFMKWERPDFHHCSCLCISVPHAGTARILISMNLAGQVVFLYTADYIHWGHSTVTAAFALSYLTVSLLQVSVWYQRCKIHNYHTFFSQRTLSQIFQVHLVLRSGTSSWQNPHFHSLGMILTHDSNSYSN